MKRYLVPILVALTVIGITAVAASPSSDQSANSRFIPVLVNVDTHGTVTKVDPAVKMRPTQTRELKETIAKMISKPAMKNGHAVNSQFVMKFAVESPADGSQKYSLRYLSVKSLPPGTWHWVVSDESGPHRFALASGLQQKIFDTPGLLQPALPHQSIGQQRRQANPSQD